ncbi:MAG: hypothetical protein AAGF15_10955 [Pseudomonadota bacterium]
MQTPSSSYAETAPVNPLVPSPPAWRRGAFWSWMVARRIWLVAAVVGFLMLAWQSTGILVDYVENADNYTLSNEPTTLAEVRNRLHLAMAAELGGRSDERLAAWAGRVSRALDENDTELARGYLNAAPILLTGAPRDRFDALESVAWDHLGRDPLLRTLGAELAQAREAIALDLLPQKTAERYRYATSDWGRFERGGRAFLAGFASGDVSSAAALSGAVSADFLIWGDIRDLSVQSYKLTQGEDADMLLLTLSGVGLGLTAATVASGGAAAPVKAGASVLKAAKRAGLMSKHLLKTLNRTAGRVVDSPQLTKSLGKAFDNMSWARVRSGESAGDVATAFSKSVNKGAAKTIESTADDVWVIRQKTSTRGALKLVAHADSPGDLKKLAQISRAGGKRTLVASDLLGKTVLKTAKTSLKVSARVMAELAALAFAIIGLLAAAFWPVLRRVLGIHTLRERFERSLRSWAYGVA